MLALAPTGSAAQVVLDGSLGPTGAIAGPDARIPEAAGRRAGPNLFHSFNTFGVREGESVTFEGDADVEAIVGRVTGGGLSRIDGLLASDAPNADVYILNPAGVVVGEGAELDLPGSLHLSTADSVGFANGERFNAAGGPAPVFTTAPPADFGFLGPDNGAISFEGPELELEDGAALTIAAGAIHIEAGEDPAIGIEGGSIRLTAIAGAGRVAIANGSTDAVLGTISLTGLGGGDEEDDDAEVEDDDGDDAPDPQIDVSGEESGEVLIRAGALSVRDFSIAADVEGEATDRRTAISVSVTGDADFDGESQFASISSGNGRAGDVVIRAGRLLMAGDAELLSDVQSAGTGGDVIVQADLARLDGDAEIAADVDEGASGTGGSVMIDAGRIELGGESEISSDTSGPGAGGAVRLTAQEEISIFGEAGVFTDARDAGAAGSAFLTAPLIRMEGGVVSAAAAAEGAGGSVTFDAGEIRLANGAFVTAQSFGPAPAGDLFLGASGDFLLSDASVRTSSAAANGGRIFINTGGALDLFRSSVSTSVASGIGDGGDVTVNAGALVLDRGTIMANAVGGAGGDVMVSAGAIFFGVDAAITATSERNVDGTISVTAPEADVAAQLAALDASLIDVDDLLRAPCAARAPGQEGTLGAEGASILPVSPLGGLGIAFTDGASANLELSEGASMEFPPLNVACGF